MSLFHRSRQTEASRSHVSRAKKGARAGFTLIEMIAVLSIITILVAVATLNVIGQMKQAARKSEAQSMESMRDALRSYILRNKHIPAPADWPKAIAAELGVPLERVTKTRIGYPRFFCEDPLLDVGAATNGTRKLPFIQGATGSVEPLNPRLTLVSTLGTNLPALATNQSAVFDDIWATQASSVPSGWTTWGASGEDLWIQRLDLRSLFRRVVFNNLDPDHQAPYSIQHGSTSLVQCDPADDPSLPKPVVEEYAAAGLPPNFLMMALVPPPITPPPSGPTGLVPPSSTIRVASGQRLEMWLLETTAIRLLFSDETVQAQEFLREDVSYVFENGRWSRYTNYGPRPPLSGFGLLAEQFRTAAVPAGSRFGATPQAVMEEAFTYLFTYGVWATGNPPTISPFDPGGSNADQQVPSYQTLLDAQKRLEAISANLVN
ncbi:MAG: type II secretion system protein [Verrucomicrobiales bacterium]|nr:type II secretion system protein [Verrucomicrobiales bacterium]